jgi:hypothetical protein
VDTDLVDLGLSGAPDEALGVIPVEPGDVHHRGVLVVHETAQAGELAVDLADLALVVGDLGVEVALADAPLSRGEGGVPAERAHRALGGVDGLAALADFAIQHAQQRDQAFGAVVIVGPVGHGGSLLARKGGGTRVRSRRWWTDRSGVPGFALAGGLEGP